MINLNKQYDEVMTTIAEYHAFSNEISSRLMFPLLRALKIYSKYSKRLYRELKDDLLIKRTPIHQEILEDLFKTDEKSSELYKMFASAYPVHEMSCDLVSKHPHGQFEKLLELHHQRIEERRKQGFDSQKLISLPIAIGSVILQFTPESIVEPWLKIPYEEFQKYVFIYMLIVLSGVCLFAFVQFNAAFKNRQRDEFILEVLKYTSLRLADDSTE